MSERIDAIVASEPPVVPMLLSSCARAAPDGLALELGVASGKSIREIALAIPERRVFGFDSFEGLPEDWRPPTYGRGHFACDVPAVPDNVTLVVGMFQDTLPVWLAANPGRVAFCHVDCDLYSSASFALRALAPRLSRGSIVVFDELVWAADRDDYKEHEYKAFSEFLEATGLEPECLGRAHSESYAFRLW